LFNKLMNNFYYGKSGKGDFREQDLPKNRWQLFWEMLRVRFSALMRLNLMYMLCWLPAMIVLMMGVLGLLTQMSSDEEMTVETLRTLLSSMSFSTLLLLIPCITITGPFTAGITYVTRNWARDEHAFIWADFKDAVKDNWKQGLAVSFITGLVPFFAYVCWNFYGQMSQQSTFMVIPQVLVMMVAIIWALSVTYMYPLMVTYKLRFRDLMRNALLLSIARLPQSIGVRLLHCVPAVIAFVVALYQPTYAIMGLFLYYMVLGFGLSRFITASYTNGVFDRYINSRIEGVQINRGMYTGSDDDDDDDEDEENQDQSQTPQE
jgi:uncharacterized membrane protein YesL